MGSRRVALATMVLLAASCTGTGRPAPTPAPEPFLSTRPLRAAVEDFGFTDNLDPVGESSPLGMALLSELLARSLLTYRHTGGRAGTIPVPDLATDEGRVTPDGLTWTFTLKRGIRFGPPIGRPVTSADVAYAFRRIDTRSLGAQYGYLFDGLIVGMNGPKASMPRAIEGIQTPDARTIVFHLTRPAGNFRQLLALPATAPVPTEAARCLSRSGDYGLDLVSSGPYLIRGADGVDISSCRALKAMDGYVPGRALHLVRNPTYDIPTDNAAVRQNYPETIDIGAESDAQQILGDIDSGELHAGGGDPNLTKQLLAGFRHLTPHWEQLDGLAYLSMNVLVPPFDDVYTRRAVTLALDREALVRVVEVSQPAAIATGIFPPVLGVPRRAPLLPVRGDLEAARREMAQSRYDSNGDGICDARVCQRVLYVGPTIPPGINALPLIQQELARIGIHLVMREIDTGTAYRAVRTVRELIPISMQVGTPLYPDPAGVAHWLDSAGITCDNPANLSNVGITEVQAATCRVLHAFRRSEQALPVLDQRISQCERASGAAASRCWSSFDADVTKDLAPWAPLWFPDRLIVTGRTLAKFGYDQAFGTIAFCHVALAGHPD